MSVEFITAFWLEPTGVAKAMIAVRIQRAWVKLLS